MFARSAAPDTLQGKAIQSVNEKWGQMMPRNKRGRETIGIAVCKKKYAPFRFVLRTQQLADAGVKVSQVERMFGCPCHHALRKSVVKQSGERKGWEPFGQWSIRKAQDIARRETARLLKTNPDDETDWESIESLVEPRNEGPAVCEFVADNKSRSTALCINGNCVWKVKSAYDDIQEELLEEDAEITGSNHGVT
eukprot:CAMPEP_0198144562 /NCGR_PEP_ID=MMETSP1443-20131203/16486_1 /TAXON_ID=186043 /ORGANISM="Entomoneis sp., Strain CCMP2396" /LENGTH=193 /DNA_ID=CAMNT_0043807971 /DNA_START=333 /DNA_END=914 /DNA_ORIENTATION=-